jgi:hypothetical protein
VRVDYQSTWGRKTQIQSSELVKDKSEVALLQYHVRENGSLLETLWKLLNVY